MCQMRVVLDHGKEQEVILENVTRLDDSPEGIRVVALFEEPRVVPGARVKSIDFMAGKVILIKE